MNHLAKCPICSSEDYHPFLSCKDYTVSLKEFNIVQCQSCSFRFTNPIPEEEEIGKYYQSEDYISHSNTNKGLINKLYKIARKNALEHKLKLVKDRVKGNKLMDIGSGTGEFLHHCSHNGLIVSGIEPSEDARNFSRSQYGLTVESEARLPEIADDSYDVISMWHVMEHVYHLQERVKEIKRIIKKEGKVFIAVPNCASLDAEIYAEEWAAYDVPRHLYHFQRAQMIKLWEDNGCEVEEILPMKLDSFYVSLLSEKYLGSGLLAYPKAFLNGMRSNLSAKSSGEWSSLIYVIRK